MPYSPTKRIRSTIGAGGLNFCVRNGYRCDPSAIITRKSFFLLFSLSEFFSSSKRFPQNYSMYNLLQPFLSLVKPSTYQYQSAQCITTLTHLTYLPDLPSGVLLPLGMGNLILRFVSRLDAFSAYQFQTQLPSCASGETTGSPAVCPTRSSRTRVSSLQISCACDGQGPNCLTTF